MSDFDLIVRGGLVIDGTGLPRRRVDVGVTAGRVAALAHLDRRTGTPKSTPTG
jgi:N-acyl-D-amino-acid deacylase